MTVSRILLLTAATAITAASMSLAPAYAKKASKYCQGDRHMHYGNGVGSTKARAKRAATQSWANFTVFEYGRAYGKWSLSRYKRASCRRGGGQWACAVEANPCRRG